MSEFTYRSNIPEHVTDALKRVISAFPPRTDRRRYTAEECVVFAGITPSGAIRWEPIISLAQKRSGRENS